MALLLMLMSSSLLLSLFHVLLISSSHDFVSGFSASRRGRPLMMTADASKEELLEKLRAYQQFVAKYIVDAQEQKIKAIKEAETETMKRMEARFQLAPSSSATANPASPAAAAAAAAPQVLQATKETHLYLERNARVTEAAKAGKSRWGDLEVQRVSNLQVVTAATTTATPVAVNGAVDSSATEPASIVVPPEVAAADHGLRSSGGVGGWSLAERVALGAKVAASASPALVINGATVPAVPIATAAPPTTKIIYNPLYHQRNVVVIASAQAGKSRWGEREIQRISQWTASLPPQGVAADANAKPIAAADHGLRSSGGVGGPTMAERVNLGAKLLGKL